MNKEQEFGIIWRQLWSCRSSIASWIEIHAVAQKLFSPNLFRSAADLDHFLPCATLLQTLMSNVTNLTQSTYYSTLMARTCSQLAVATRLLNFECVWRLWLFCLVLHKETMELQYDICYHMWWMRRLIWLRPYWPLKFWWQCQCFKFKTLALPPKHPNYWGMYTGWW